MRSWISLIVAIFGIVNAEIELDGNVLVLNDDNFAEALQTNDQMLVEFYAPWCGHCKTLAPEWAKAATTLKDSPVKLAKVDATESKTLGTEYGIKGFPTIKYFKRGKASDYQGGRTAKDIVSWANKKSGPAAKVIASEEQLAAFQENEVVVLGVFSNADSPNARAFLHFAGGSEADVPFGLTTSDEVRSSLGVSGDSVVVLKSFDNGRSDLPILEPFDDELIAEFILAETVPLIQEFSQESSSKIFKNPITKHALFFTKKAAPHHASTLAVASKVAEEYKGKVLFVSVPSSADTSRVLDYFDLKDADLPRLILADMAGGGGMKKFPFQGEFTQEGVSSFFADFFAGKMKAAVKSEEPSPEDTAGGVTVVKGKSFNELVINNNKDVFIEFYAPWCGHCKQLAPTWDALAAEFAANSNIVIAKMDATANEIDIDSLAVKGFPTLFFLKGDNKANPVKYEGPRELKDLVDYVKQNAVNAGSAAVAEEEAEAHGGEL